jgi:Ca-activated chloride channel family protein
MTFTSPWALLGLLATPYILWLGWPRGAWARRRDWTSLALRVLIVLLVVLGLAGLQIVRAADQLAVVFLVDASDSMSEPMLQAALAYIDDALARMGPDDRAAVIVFGADALVERPMSPARELGPVDSVPLPINTDLAEAIRLGMALYPEGAARRMVILSDGLANVGDAEQAARLAGASGVQIDMLPFAAAIGPEVLVASVDAPTRLNQGQTFDLEITIESVEETSAILRVLGGGRVLYEETVELRQGSNHYALSLTAGEPGLATYRVQIVPSGDDQFYQNNELSAFSQVVGPPRVLIVAEDQTEAYLLGEALLDTGLIVDQTIGAGLPTDLSALTAYNSVILVNVPASALSPRKMAALQTYVRDLGGGLVTVGGPNSYGVGGYFRTPLEETLPVEMQLKDQERLPQLTIVFVIDKSGSMSELSGGGVPKVELAKEAIIRSIDLLGPLDRVGVVAFDESAAWVVDVQPADNPDEIARRVATIRADGGTDIYAGLLAVSKVLPEDESKVRHIVLLTDGGADPTNIPELVSGMYDQDGISLSVVAVGQGYAPFLEGLPELAGGRFHATIDPDTVPEIFTQETILATRAYIIEEPFYPTLVSHSPILSGIEATPRLLGYVGTSSKPTAQTILITEQGDPLLAAWQYGLGRSVAWTSDATGRWAIDWVRWDGFARFWSQAVRWTIVEGATRNVEVTVEPQGERARVVVDALDDEGEYLNGLELEASVVAPGLISESIEMRQVAPGRYEGEFTPTEEGAYFVRVAGSTPEQTGEGVGLAQTTGWVMSYSPEYRPSQGNPDYLAYLAGLTGGSAVEDMSRVFAHDLRVQRATQPVWPWLLLAAVSLFPFDVAVRRLVITRADLARLWAWVDVIGRLRRSAGRAAPQRVERLGTLFEAKQRASTERRTADVLPMRTPVEPGPGVEPSEAPSPTPRPSKAPAAPPPAPATGETLASRLLKRKREGEDSDR